MDYIVTRRQIVGETEYISADLIDLPELVKRGLLNEDVVKHLTRNQELAPLTPETFSIAVARRPGGSVWPPRGFTQAYLEEMGLVDRGFAPAEHTPAPAKAQARRKHKGKEPRKVVQAELPTAPPSTATHVELTKDAIKVGDNYLQPGKRGPFVFFQAAAADGRILHVKLFKSKEKGIEFLETLSTPDAAPATPEPEKPAEDSDDGDVRSDAGDGQGQDPSEDR